MILNGNEKIVFIGDSITDCERARPVGEGTGDSLGRSYVSIVNAMLTVIYPTQNIRVVNMGISGNTTRELVDRWQTDVLDLEPDWLTIMIGINDVWRHFNRPLMPEVHVGIQEYEENLLKLTQSSQAQGSRLILMSPFYLETNREDAMRKMMDQYGQAAQRVAKQCDAIFVDIQAAFDEYLSHHYTTKLAMDRVHPNMIGHLIIARAWLNAVGFEWS